MPPFSSVYCQNGVPSIQRVQAPGPFRGHHRVFECVAVALEARRIAENLLLLKRDKMVAPALRGYRDPKLSPPKPK
eukprot:scaffold16203_cov71-Skeletonema_dohrnii-CCMP3373.AAC.3